MHLPLQGLCCATYHLFSIDYTQKHSDKHSNHLQPTQRNSSRHFLHCLAFVYASEHGSSTSSLCHCDSACQQCITQYVLVIGLWRIQQSQLTIFRLQCVAVHSELNINFRITLIGYLYPMCVVQEKQMIVGVPISADFCSLVVSFIVLAYTSAWSPRNFFIFIIKK